MKLAKWEKRAIEQLRKLDEVRRGWFAAEIDAAARADEVIKKAAGMTKLQPVTAHKLLKAYGVPPVWKYEGRAIVRVQGREPRRRAH